MYVAFETLAAQTAPLPRPMTCVSWGQALRALASP